MMRCDYDDLLFRAEAETTYQKPMKDFYTPRVNWIELYPVVKELKENKEFPFKEISIWLEKVSGIKLSQTTINRKYNEYKRREDEGNISNNRW